MKILNTSLVLILVLILTIGTNLIDRENFNKIDDATSEMYADRLMVQDIIYDYLKVVHTKQQNLLQSKTDLYLSTSSSDQAHIRGLEKRYAATKLTPEEEERFLQLKAHSSHLFELENSSELQLNDPASVQSTQALLAEMTTELDQLNDIQVMEGKTLNSESTKAASTINLLSTMEISFIAIILVILAGFYFTRNKENELFFG